MNTTVSVKYDSQGSVVWKHELQKNGNKYEALTFFFSKKEIDQYQKFFLEKKNDTYIYRFSFFLLENGDICEDDEISSPTPLCYSLTHDKWILGINEIRRE